MKYMPANQPALLFIPALIRAFHTAATDEL